MKALTRQCDGCGDVKLLNDYPKLKEQYLKKDGSPLTVSFYGDHCTQCLDALGPKLGSATMAFCKPCNIEHPVGQFRVIRAETGAVDYMCHRARREYNIKQHQRRKAEKESAQPPKVQPEPAKPQPPMILEKLSRTTKPTEPLPKLLKPDADKGKTSTNGGRQQPTIASQKEAEHREMLLQKAKTHVARPGSIYHLSAEDKERLKQQVKQKEKPLNGRNVL